MKLLVNPLLIQRIKDNLTPDLLRKDYKYDPNNPLRGHCYVASEALYHLIGEEYLCPVVASYGNGKTHWWIVNKTTGGIYDLTGEQFERIFLLSLYKKGRKCGFLTREPSKRCKILLEKIRKLK
jgi:hypothetical protein